ncbi:DUF6884 domain-containing protein [Halobacterium sp. R2-5]|uniref:DUF6884 domain-containing protein n=1 Tax=Halobacterium sp. R2-5 TaxID=2715751 RepID=UPI001423EA02|nr:DUF6884 domain-containing protein [Halobacterium sp. R2-5]NIC00931.1 hypothetical protein [Halobacterium sp. R2-5]
MSSLLVQGCSKSKNEPGEPVPALDLYSGFFFKIIKKAKREEEFDEDIDLCILSAEHGLIDPDDEISWYDRRMDANRAADLAPEVKKRIVERADDYERIIVNVGGDYNRALEGVESVLDVPVYFIEGDGIGYKGSILKQLVRGDLEALETNTRTIAPVQ